MNGHLRSLLVACLLATAGASAWAQSACTAMWGILSNGAVTRLAYYNSSAGTASKWTTLSFTLTGGTNANALAGDSTGGLLYYFDRTGAALHLHSVNLNTYQDTDLGVIPASPDGNAAIIGATADAAGKLYMMSSTGAGNTPYHIAQITKTAPVATVTSWTTVTYTAGGGQPFSNGSGDFAVDQAGQAYLATNTNPSAVYPLTLATSKVGASVTYAVGALGVAGLGVNPVTGLVYMGGATGGSLTYRITPTAGNSHVLVDATNSAAYLITDIGNCVATPAPPTVSKSFSPTFQALGGATATLSIAIVNANTAPIWLTSTFTDTLPAGMTVAATPALSAGACAASTSVTNVITATAGATTMTFATGGRIPAGGCTISFSVTAAASANAYTNTIAAGALATTSGSNAAAATATLTVGTDFAAAKSQRLGTAGATGTASITVPGGQTMQYVLTIVNSSTGGTGSATFTDTLPAQITPVLSITPAMSGGGSCTTASAVVGGATQVTGTLTNAPAGAVCTITVTTRVSAVLAVPTNVTNTLTVAAVATTSDTSSTNNVSAVPTTVGPSAVITISKTNGTVTVVSGSTTSYTVTISNLGPATAPGTTVLDASATGLNCTTITFTSTPAGSITTIPSPLTLAALQSTGIQLTPTFPASSTATFNVTCAVTATGS